MEYVKAKKAREQLGVSDNTLRAWADSGKIKSIRLTGGNRLYNVREFIERNSGEIPTKKCYIYCRVSSYKQKEDLERQIRYLSGKYPKHEIVSDIASGINFKRKGLNKILADSMQGIVKEVVVAHRDRLCRIAFEHFRWLFEQNGVTLVVDDTQAYSPEEEFNDDLLSIIHVFSSRHYGIRGRYTSRGSENEEIKNLTEKQECSTWKDGKKRSRSH